jgi:hypothetical protein
MAGSQYADVSPGIAQVVPAAFKESGVEKAFVSLDP